MFKYDALKQIYKNYMIIIQMKLNIMKIQIFAFRVSISMYLLRLGSFLIPGTGQANGVIVPDAGLVVC